MERTQLPGDLGAMLDRLVDTLRAPIVALAPVAGSGTGAALRLTLADGVVLKAKRLADAGQALRVARLVQRLAHPSFPAVRARHGAVIVTDWVPGRALDAVRVERDQLRTCGALHAFVHTRRVDTDASTWRSPLARVRLQSSLDALALAGLISRNEVEAAMRVARRHAPEMCRVGLMHGDINAANVVCDDGGRLSVIDNDTLSIGAYAYDLARTWYRWPMTDSQWSAYLAGYQTMRPADDLQEHLPFWRIAVLARGAAFRLQANRPQIDVPIARLRLQVETWR